MICNGGIAILESGDQVYDWTILNIDETKKSHYGTYYICKCKCGNIVSIRGSALTGGKSKRCRKCSNKITKTIDETGNRYGLLTVIKRDNVKHGNRKGTSWLCKCDCGCYCSVLGSDLRIGETKSCGCLGKSYGETKIKEILQENSITFVHDRAYFQDLINDNGSKLRYDFIVFDENNNILEIIEFDGIQHFQETNYFHNNLTENKKIDTIKNNYAKQHNYKLLRIPYNRINDINFQTLFDNTFLFN